MTSQITPKDRPILFKDEMVRAILDGRKTQTRRVVKPWEPRPSAAAKPLPEDVAYLPDFTCYRSTCPYGKPGDRLWVRETFMHEPADYCWEASVSIPCIPASTSYRADFGDEAKGAGWKPSIHMPRALSRITLEITGVRVERLQTCNEADAIAEGAPWAACGAPQEGSHKAGFAQLWESINGPGSWDSNPWVWVIEFKRVAA